MNRLNFSQMVNKTLNSQQEIKFFNTSEIKTEQFYQPEKYSAKIKKAKERLNLDGKIKSFVLNVHEKLRERELMANTSKTQLKQAKANSKQKAKSNKQLKPTEVKLEDFECKSISLPRIKVLISDKHKKNAQNSSKANTNYDDHKRMVGSVERNCEMQDLLNEHQMLKEDRQSLEQDIFALRHVLDDCQHRVNYSLEQLNKRKTYCECHDIKSSKRCIKNS